MPMQPSRSQVHVNRPLTNISVAYIQSAEDFIADKVFPMVPVLKQSDRYFVYEKSFWFSTQSRKRAPGTESAGTGFDIDNTPTYFCDVWAVHQDIDDQTRQNADEPIDLDRDATLYVTQQNLLRREIEFVQSYLQPNIWQGDPNGDFTPTVTWDSSSSDPMQDVDNEKRQVKSQTGKRPNVFAVADDVFYVLRNNAAVLDRIKYTQRAVVTEEILAALFGIEKFLVADAVYNSAAESKSSTPPNYGGTFDFLVKNVALLVWANPSPSIMQPSGGYIFQWTGLLGAGAYGTRIKTFRIEPRESDRVEGEMAFNCKLVGADLGVFFQNVINTSSPDV